MPRTIWHATYFRIASHLFDGSYNLQFTNLHCRNPSPCIFIPPNNTSLSAHIRLLNRNSDLCSKCMLLHVLTFENVSTFECLQNLFELFNLKFSDSIANSMKYLANQSHFQRKMVFDWLAFMVHSAVSTDKFLFSDAKIVRKVTFSGYGGSRRTFKWIYFPDLKNTPRQWWWMYRA